MVRGFIMYDYGLSVMEQYGLTVKSSYRGRGALICETQRGFKIVKEYRGSEKKLEAQRKLQLHILESGETRVDCVLENEEGKLVSSDRDGIPYVVREWFTGRECDTKSASDILEGVKALARLHSVMQMPLEENYRKESLLDECTRHNREIRKIGNFIRKKNSRTDFEMQLLRCMDSFLKQGETAVEQLERSGYQELYRTAMERGSVCHGECNQHNIIWTGGRPTLINYEKWNYDVQVADLYQFMRKILEKHNWDIGLGKSMLNGYHSVKPLSEEEVLNLKIRLSYPWKFWKLVNYYANNHKAWISGRNSEKLQLVMRQQKAWSEFLKTCFSDFLFSSDTL